MKRRCTTSEARLHIGLARTILETLKVEIAAAHFSQGQIPSVPVAKDYGISTTTRPRQ